MSTTTTSTGTAAAPSGWARADDGLWVMSYAGSFGGTVDQQGAHYFVSDTFGRYVGDFADLPTAKHRLDQHLRTTGLLV